MSCCAGVLVLRRCISSSELLRCVRRCGLAGPLVKREMVVRRVGITGRPVLGDGNAKSGGCRNLALEAWEMIVEEDLVS